MVCIPMLTKSLLALHHFPPVYDNASCFIAFNNVLSLSFWIFNNMQCIYSLTSRRVRVTIVAVLNNTCYIIWVLRVCILSLDIQLAKRSNRIVLSSLACTTVQYLNTLRHELHDFRKKKTVTEHKLCIFILSTNFSEIFLSLRKIQWDNILNIHSLKKR